MKLAKIISGSIVSLVTLSFVIGCQNTNLSSTDNLNTTVEAESVKKQRAPKYFVKIATKDKAQILDIASKGIDIFGSGEGGRFDAYVTDKQAAMLKAAGVNFTNTNSTIADRGGLPGGYHTVDQVLSIMKDLAAKYPDITQMVDIGDSWEKTAGKGNNDIWAFVVSNKKNTAPKSSAVFFSGVHARELVTVEINMRFMDMILSGYGKDPNITKYVDSREIVFIPLANIDGRRAVEKGESMWRKNRHIDNTYDGIDINRNFDGHWNFQGVPMNSTLNGYRSELEDKGSEIYSGPSPASEPETQAIAKYLGSKKVTISMDLHSYGNMVIYPPGYTTSPVAATPTFKKVAQVLASKNHYRTGTSMELLYPTCGTSKDWAYDKFNAISFTMEMGNDSDGFRPPFSRVDQIWNENKDGLLYLVSIADNPMRIK